MKNKIFAVLTRVFGRAGGKMQIPDVGAIARQNAEDAHRLANEIHEEAARREIEKIREVGHHAQEIKEQAREIQEELRR